MEDRFIADYNDLLLVTGANGFIGSKVVETLLGYGFKNLRCFVRPSGNLDSLERIISTDDCKIELFQGNLLSREDCQKAAAGAAVIFHLAAGIEKTFPGCFLNSVVTTRNLLDAVLREDTILKRFLNVSSFAVYTNWKLKRHALLDETCEVENHLVERYEAYTFAKAKQDEMVMDYGRKHRIPYVIVRPGAVYGPGKTQLTGRVGIETFGFFMHLGGSNQIPLTYVDNCAEAIVLGGIVRGVDGEIFNIVDDELPASRKFLKLYKKNAGHFRSVYIPYPVFFFLCWLWEKYSKWSEGQLPPAFNRRRCSAYWKGNRYSNAKLKRMLHWKPRVPFKEAAQKYFESARMHKSH